MAEELDGEEFVVDKILDKRVRNGKIEYYLSWKVNFPFAFIRMLHFYTTIQCNLWKYFEVLKQCQINVLIIIIFIDFVDV